MIQTKQMPGLRETAVKKKKSSRMQNFYAYEEKKHFTSNKCISTY